MPVPVQIPTLTDGVVTLRALGPGDLDALVEQSRDPETVRWTTVPDRYTAADGREFIARQRTGWESGERCGWAIEHEGRFAGLVSHQPRAIGAVEVAFAAHPASRGHGLMTRALRLVAAHAFDHGADVVLWHAHLGNFGSRKVAWRCGFEIGAPIVTTRRDQVVELWPGWLRRGEAMEPRQPWLDVPDVVGPTVRIRPFRDDDRARFPARHDPLIAAFSANLPTRHTYPAWLLSLRTRAAEGAALACAVADRATDELLGGVDLGRLDVPLFAGTGMLGFWLLPDARGRGVLGSALELLLPWALRPASERGLGLHRLSAGCAVGNMASARALRRAGFAQVGTEREALSVAGSPVDELLFELLAADDRDARRREPGRIPVVETARFRLRPWRPEDAPTAQEEPDEAARRFLPASAQPTADTHTAWLAMRRLRAEAGWGLDWCVADRDTDHALGNVTLFGIDPGPAGFQAELGYWLHPAARGRHVLAEVLPPVIEYAFRPPTDAGMGLTRLHASTDVDNVASQAALLRAGFRSWGRDRQVWRNRFGELTDGAHFELLASDDRRGDDAR